MNPYLNFEELKASGALPSPKGIALAVMGLCQSESTNLPELVTTITRDPVLSGQIIKMANAVNPDRTRPIASVTVDTLIIIGIHAIRQAVLGFSLIATYKRGKCVAFNYSNYWAHSLAMACAAKSVGSFVRIAPLTEVFTCGLLAEVGQLVLATARSAEYAEMLLAFRGKPESALIQAEIEHFGMGRRALAGLMMKDWGMPQIFIDVVSAYDIPEMAGVTVGSRHYNLALGLQLASQIADRCLMQDSTAPAISSRMIETGTALNLNGEQIAHLANRAVQDWLQWSALLSLKRASANIPRFEFAIEASGATQNT